MEVFSNNFNNRLAERGRNLSGIKQKRKKDGARYARPRRKHGTSQNCVGQKVSFRPYWSSRFGLVTMVDPKPLLAPPIPGLVVP
jgi:hypothetical protein